MEDQLISFETAKLAKEKDFVINCKEGWRKPNSNHDRQFINADSLLYCFNGYAEIQRPTQTLLQKWLREVHNLDVEPEKYQHDKHGRFYKVRIWGEEMSNEGYLTGFNYYEEALEAGLFEALTLI